MAKKDRFNYFDAFEKQIDVATEEAKLLLEVIEDFETADELLPVLHKAHAIENRGDELTHVILANVATDFITPFDREDVIRMAQDIDDITDLIEGVIQRFYMFNIHFMHPTAKEFAELILDSLKALRTSMEGFRSFKKVKKIRAMVAEVNEIEERADALYAKTIRHLYVDDASNPVRVDVWSHLFDRLEGACDACEAVADTMATVMLKNV